MRQKSKEEAQQEEGEGNKYADNKLGKKARKSTGGLKGIGKDV